MSTRVKERLKKLRLETNHEDRVQLDAALEHFTGKPCDEGIELLTDEQVKEIVKRIKKKRKNKPESSVEPSQEQIAEVVA